MAETLPLYPIPDLMQPLPMEKTFQFPDPFFPIEGALGLWPPKGFVRIAGRYTFSIIYSVSSNFFLLVYFLEPATSKSIGC